jgi:hypothetical protein
MNMYDTRTLPRRSGARVRFLFTTAVAASVAALVHCTSDNTTTDGGPAQCVPNQSMLCACTSGASGAQVCQADGTYAPCVCDGTDASSNGDATVGGADAMAEAASFGGDGSADASSTRDATADSADASPEAAVPLDAPANDATPDAFAPPDGSFDAAADAMKDAALTTLYATGFEGACPDGWTLTGDWQCGVPTNVGPPTAFEGTQCIGTILAGDYDDNQAFAATTATSPEIDLTHAVSPTLTFRMWVDTEGGTYDGANFQISIDGGASFSLIQNVTPGYPLVVQGQPAWGGHESALGWQLVSVDLSAYAGGTIELRFAFASNASSTFPGVYIDDVRVLG